MGGKSRLPVLGDFPIVDGIMNSWAIPQWGSFFGVWRNAVRASSVMGLEITQKFQVISSTISLTFNVDYLPSVFQIISAKLLIRYICDIPIHHKENKQAELTRPS